MHEDRASGGETGRPAASPLIRIVLADRRGMEREGIRRILEAEEDLSVVGEAGELEEAAQVARSLRPDVLVLDVTMGPVPMDRLIERFAAILPPERYVLLTDDEQEQYEALAEAGVRSVLPKTASVRDLIAAIRAVHYGHRIRPSPSLALPGEWGRDAPTRRELEVLRLAAQGRSTREIADELAIAERTVEFHLGHTFEKLGARSRTEAIHLARQRGWID